MIIIEVKNGMLANETGCQALTCAGEQLTDGFYFLPLVEEDPPHRKPYRSMEDARKAGADWLLEQKNDETALTKHEIAENHLATVRRKLTNLAGNVRRSNPYIAKAVDEILVDLDAAQEILGDVE